MSHLYYDRLYDVTEIAFKLRICLFHMQARSKWSAPSKHPTKRFRLFKDQGVLGLRIPGEFRVKAKLIGRVWVGLNQSNSKGSLFLQQKPYHVWGHNLNSPIFIHFPYAFAEGVFFYPKSGAHPSHPKKSECFFWKFDRLQSLVKKQSRFCFSEFTILRWDYISCSNSHYPIPSANFGTLRVISRWFSSMFISRGAAPLVVFWGWKLIEGHDGHLVCKRITWRITMFGRMFGEKTTTTTTTEALDKWSMTMTI